MAKVTTPRSFRVPIIEMLQVRQFLFDALNTFSKHRMGHGYKVMERSFLGMYTYECIALADETKFDFSITVDFEYRRVISADINVGNVMYRFCPIYKEWCDSNGDGQSPPLMISMPDGGDFVVIMMSVAMRLHDKLDAILDG